MEEWIGLFKAKSGKEKLILCAVPLVLLITLGLTLFLHASKERVVPLYPIDCLSTTEVAQITDYLTADHVPFEKKGEALFCVPQKEVERIKQELLAIGIPKEQRGGGLELFDSNTWIKGEKELQVLELRALKGQLEKDISSFENIARARVILDIPPSRTIGGGVIKAKASVIVTLQRGAHLSASLVQAIAHHMAGAVHALEPEMVAIMDTQGRIYQGIGGVKNAHLSMDEEIRAKIEEVLVAMMGKGHFITLMRPSYEKGTFSLLVLVNKNSVQEGLREEIERKIKLIARTLGLDLTIAVEFTTHHEEAVAQKGKWPPYTLWAIATALSLIATLFFFLRKKEGGKSEENLSALLHHVSTEKLVDTLKKEEPRRIAMLLSYLEPQRAERVISQLPEDVQDKVLERFEELEGQR